MLHVITFVELPPFLFNFFFLVNFLLSVLWCSWHQEEHPACKNWVMKCWCGCSERGADCLHMVQLMLLHPTASFISRLVLPFWYRLTRVVLEKRLFKGCSSGCSSFLVNLAYPEPLLVFFLHLFCKRTFTDKQHGFCGLATFLSPIQQWQCIEQNLLYCHKQWSDL